MPTELEQQISRYCAWLEQQAGMPLRPGADDDGAFDTFLYFDDQSSPPPSESTGPRVKPLTPLAHRRRWVLGAAAVVAVAASIAGIAVLTAGDDTPRAPVDSATVPVSTAPAVAPTAAPRPNWGGMWPQSSIEEVLAAQERALAGDPDYTWQARPHVAPTAPYEHFDFEVVDRFLREVLGWEAYRFNETTSGEAEGEDGDGWPDTGLANQQYIRCATTGTNRYYPSEPCAPTIDDHSFESVSLDLVQVEGHGRDGIWYVSRSWRTDPFAQVDPVPLEARAKARLEEYLAARVAGSGTEGYVYSPDYAEVPLLYATTAGAPFERYEIERADGPWWPYGGGVFLIRLFAGGDATVVEQKIAWDATGGLRLENHSTTENGRAIVVSRSSEDGLLTVSAPDTWSAWLPGKGADAWFGGLWRQDEFFGSGERVELVDPVAYDAWCADNGGSPLLTAPADAAAIAQQVIADPDFETTAPVTTSVGGLEAISMDVSLAPGGKACGVYMIEISRWIQGLEPGWRMRLYLVDLPAGMSVETLAITVAAPEDRFEEVIAETAPIIDSIEFHPA